jgi:hypothetical protein
MIEASFTFYLAGSQALGSEAAARNKDLRQAREFVIINRGRPQTIKLVPGRETKRIHYSGPAQFSLLKNSGTDAEGNILYEPVLDIQLPTNWKTGMLALFGRGENYSLFPLETTKSAFRTNTALFYNISNTQILCKAGETQMTLPPYGSESVSLESLGSDLQLEIKCAALASGTDRRLVYSGSQTVKPDQYYIFLLTPDASGKNYRILRFKPN